MGLNGCIGFRGGMDVSVIGAILGFFGMVSYLAGLVAITSFCIKRLKINLILKSVIAGALVLISTLMPLSMIIGLAYNTYHYDENTKNMLKLIIYLYGIVIIGIGLYMIAFDYYKLYKKNKLN
jgi:hypothetical protein